MAPGILERLGLRRPSRFAEGEVYVLGRDSDGQERRVLLRRAYELPPGLVLARGSAVELHDDGSILSGTLDDDQRFEGIDLAAGTTVRCWPGGALAEATLVDDLQMQDIDLEASSVVSFDRHGQLLGARLPRDAEVDGLPCAASKPLRFEDWRLLEATLSEDCEVEGQACAAGSEVVMVRGAGQQERKLVRFTPQRDVTVAGIRCAGRSEVELHPRGQLLRATLARPKTIDELRCAAAEVTFYEETGALRRCTLEREAHIDGILWAASHELELYATGAVARGRLADDVEIDGLIWAGGEELLRDPQGAVLQGTLASEATIGGVPCAPGEPLRLLPYKGKLSEATLARDHVLEGTVCRGGTRVRFGLGGKLLRYTPAGLARRGRWRCAAGEEVELTELGALHALTLGGNKRVYGWRLPPATRVRFGGDLPLVRVTLGADLRRGPVQLRAGQEMTIRNWGGAQLVLEDELEIGPHRARAGDEIWLRSEGSVQFWKLGSAHLLEGTHFEAKTVLTLDKRGRLRGAELAVDHRLDGLEVLAVRGLVTAHWTKQGALEKVLLAADGREGAKALSWHSPA